MALIPVSGDSHQDDVKEQDGAKRNHHLRSLENSRSPVEDPRGQVSGQGPILNAAADVPLAILLDSGGGTGWGVAPREL